MENKTGRYVSWLIVVGLFLTLIAISPAHASYISSVSVSPAQPTAADTVTLTVQGTLPTPCYTFYPPTVTQTGTDITINISAVASGGICVQVLGSFSVNAALAVLSPSMMVTSLMTIVGSASSSVIVKVAR